MTRCSKYASNVLAGNLLQEPWRYNAYLKRLLQRVDDGGLSPINMSLARS